VLRPILARFLTAYPDIRVDVSLDEALTNVVAEGFDAGIRLGHALDREMIAVRVSVDQRVVVVGSPDYLAAHGRPSHPRDLHDHDCITLRNVAWRFLENDRTFEVASDGHIVTNNSGVLVDSAVDGLGLAYVFESMVRKLLTEKTSHACTRQVLPTDSGYFLYYPSRANLAPKLKALVEFVKTRNRA